MRWIAMTALALALATPAYAEPAAFVPYLAAYDLGLDPTRAAADVAPVTGRLVIEFTGSRCDGYASTVRLVTQSHNARGRSLVTDSRSTTFETADGIASTIKPTPTAGWSNTPAARSRGAPRVRL